MIDVNSLRRNNLVEYRGHILPVEGIHWSGKTIFLPSCKADISRNWKDIDEINPIPLSESLLIDSGFEKALNGWWDEAELFNVRLSDGKFSVRIAGMDFMPNDYDYLHQLQNLYFALTGKELPIKK